MQVLGWTQFLSVGFFFLSYKTKIRLNRSKIPTCNRSLHISSSAIYNRLHRITTPIVRGLDITPGHKQYRHSISPLHDVMCSSSSQII